MGHVERKARLPQIMQYQGMFLELLFHHSTHTGSEGQEATHTEPQIHLGKGSGCWMDQKIANVSDSEHVHVYTIYPKMFLQTLNPSVLSLYLGKLKGHD